MIRGSCLCDNVAFEIDGKLSDIVHCHCSKCRKYTGTAHHAVLVTRIANLTWVRGEDSLVSYTAPSGYHAVFCPGCGSPMPKMRANKVYLVPAGSLDDDPGVKATLHVHVASKAPWHAITDDLQQHLEDAPGFT